MDILTEKKIVDFAMLGLKVIGCNDEVAIDFNSIMGSCARTSCSTDKKLKLEFNIKVILKSINQWPWQEIVAHELVHVKQFLNDTIKADDKTIFWKNEDYSDDARYAQRMLRLGFPNFYRELPWEKEAFENMNVLAKEIQEMTIWSIN